MQDKIITKVSSMSSKSMEDTLSEKFEALFPSWPEMLATILSLIILLLVLGPLVYKTIQDMMAKRQKYIQDNINYAEKLSKEAIEEKNKADQDINDARRIAKEIISKAKIESEKVKDEGNRIAKKEAEKLIAQAKKDGLKEKENFYLESKKEIIEIAMQAAEKVIEKEVDKDFGEKIINEFLESKEEYINE